MLKKSLFGQLLYDLAIYFIKGGDMNKMMGDVVPFAVNYLLAKND